MSAAPLVISIRSISFSRIKHLGLRQASIL